MSATAIAVLSAVLYVEAIGHDFQNWDDPTVLLERPRVHALTWSNLQSIWTEPQKGDFFPLTETLYALEYGWQGGRPALYHVTNILLHACCSALVCFLGARLGLSIEGALVSGLVFACHPIHVETVAWVAEHKDLLAACFSLLAMLAMTDSRKRWQPYVWATGWSVAAMLSKPSAVSIGLVLFVVDVWHKKSKPRVALLRVIPLLIAGAALSLVVLVMHQSRDNVTGTFWDHPARTVLLMAYGIIFYLWKFIYPNPLIPLYPYPEHVGWGEPVFLGAVLMGVGLAILFIQTRHTKWWPLIIGLYLAGVLPVLRIVEVGRMVVADRYAYFPSVALCIGVGAGWMWMGSRVASPSRMIRIRAIGGLMLAGLAVLTVLQNRVWRNSETLWRYTIALNPESTTAHLNLGETFFQSGRYEEAEEQFRYTLQLDPHDDMAQGNLGHALSAQGKAAEAIDAYTKTLQQFPNRPRIHFYLAGILAAQDRASEAEHHYRRAIELDPDDVETLVGLSHWLESENHPDEAAQLLRRAIQIDPGHPALPESRQSAPAEPKRSN